MVLKDTIEAKRPNSKPKNLKDTMARTHQHTHVTNRMFLALAKQSLQC